MSEIKVNSIKGVGATDAAITVNNSDGTCTGNISNRPNYNLLINGQFDVWQRATTSGSTTSSGYNSADRWRFEASGATYTASQQAFDFGQTDVPSSPKYYLRFNATTANDNCGVTQRIEDVASVQGQHTLSFWAKGTNPAGGSIQVTILQYFGSGGSADVGGAIGTFSLSSSWAKKTFTFTPTSISGKTIGSGSLFKISLRQPSADDTTTAWTLDLANVKLEAGSKATDYQRINYGDELIRCKRYFEIIKPNYYNLGRFDNSNGQAFNFIQFQVTKRNPPTASTAGTFRSSQGSSGNISFDSTTVDGASIYTSNTTGVNGILYILDDVGDGSLMLKFNAEL